MADAFDSDKVLRELRRRGPGRTAEDVDLWRRVLAEPWTRSALRVLAGDTIDKMADLLADEHERLAVVARAIRHFSAQGWAPSSGMPVDLYRQALRSLDEGAKSDEIDTVLDEGWAVSGALDRLSGRIGILGAGDDDLREIAQQRERLVAKAYEHHASGAYEASIPILLAQIDGITYDATTSERAPEGRTFFSLNPGRQAEVVDDETLAGINEALPVVRRWFSTRYLNTDVLGTANRHGVLHGRELAYDTRVNSTKALVLLRAVWEWANPRLANEAQSRKMDRYARHAGSDEVDEHGWRFDRRGFSETRIALQKLADTQAAFHRSHGRYGTELELESDRLAKYPLPADTGLVIHVEDDSWFGWKRSASGWVFAIGQTVASGCLYFDSADPPATGPPDPSWRTNKDGNWSGDCYW